MNSWWFWTYHHLAPSPWPTMNNAWFH
jgi:hypothetical protein